MATLVVFLAGWLVAASLLWRTSVPTGLEVGGLDVHRYFSTRELTRASHYQRVVNALWAAHVLVDVVALAVLARRAPRIARATGLGRIASGAIVAMLVLVTLWFVSLPFGFARQWWAARHGLAPHNYVSWILAPWGSLVTGVLIALLAVAIVLGLAGRLGDRWWLAGAPLFAVLFAAAAFSFGFVVQIGTYDVKRASLRADIRSLERQEGVRDTPVRVQDVSDTTNRANAAANGFGLSASVVLWNTLLDKPFTRREIRVVVAHELGHVAHRHVLKGVGWAALLSLPIAWVLTLAARLRGGIADPGALPFVVLVLVVLNFLAAPLLNVVSRRYEAEADWAALNATQDAASARKLFVDLQRTSLQQPDPPTWDYLWLENHPTIAQRLAMVESWLKTTSAGRRSPAGS